MAQPPPPPPPREPESAPTPRSNAPYPPPPPPVGLNQPPPSSPPPPGAAAIPRTSPPLQPPPPAPDAVPQPPPLPTRVAQSKTGSIVTHSYNHVASRWGLGDAFASIGIFFFVSIGLVLILVTAVGDDDFLEGPLLPVAVVGPHVALLAHALWVGRSKGVGIVEDFKVKLTGTDIGIGFGLFVGALVAAGVVAVIITEILGEAPSSAAIDVARDSTDDTLTVWLYLFAILGATFVPFVEELVYRGLLWSALEKRGMRPAWILVATSALFAAIHLEPTRTPILFVVGLALGLGRFWTGRIGASIVTHVLINALAMTAILFELA